MRKGGQMRTMAMAAALVVALVVATAAGAGPYDGAYLTREEIDAGHTCETAEWRTLWFRDDAYDVAGDYECRLANPVPVRDMNAVLYDNACSADGPRDLERIMILTSADGVWMVSDFGAMELVRCD